jgi:hypothetical protein
MNKFHPIALYIMVTNALHEPVSLVRNPPSLGYTIATIRSNYAMPVVKYSLIEKMILKISGFKILGPDWDGHNAIPPSKEAILNSIALLKNLPEKYQDTLSIDEIIPTHYGTIILDWYNSKEELVSLEVGKTKVGYFTEFNIGESPFSNGIECNNLAFPQEIIYALDRLHKTA